MDVLPIEVMWKFNTMFSNYRVNVSVSIYSICLRCSDWTFCWKVSCMFVPHKMHPIVYNKSYRQRFYYQILGERPFVLLWICLICYRWKTLILCQCLYKSTKISLTYRINIWHQKPRYTITLLSLFVALILRNFLLYQ